VDQEGAVVSTVMNEGRLLLEYLSVCEFLLPELKWQEGRRNCLAVNTFCTPNAHHLLSGMTKPQRSLAHSVLFGGSYQLPHVSSFTASVYIRGFFLLRNLNL
jgi:hypothetical protein